MQKINFYLFLIIDLIFSIKIIFSQSLDLKKVISDIERGEIEKARVILVSLEKDNPNSSEVKYLKALLNEDGTEAARFYKEIVFSSDESELKDDALFKLYQYHYSRGEFSESDKYARMLRETFPESEYVNYLQRKNLSQARVQIQQNFERKYLSDTLQTLQKSIQNSQSQNSASSFSIQVGAFSTYSNAIRFASQFQNYSTKISEKESGGKKIFVVLVGNFKTESEARDAMQVLKNQYNVDGIIVATQ